MRTGSRARNRGATVKVYVCDTWDSLCDIGEHSIDRYCYRTRDDAEKRAARLTYTDDCVSYYAQVIELEARWKPGADETLSVWQAENAKLRKLAGALLTSHEKMCTQRGHCFGCTFFYEEVKACPYAKISRTLRELGIEV